MKVEKIDFETVLVEATKLPMVKINRENFLRKEFQGRYKNEVVEMAIQHCPAYAGIKVEEINEIAESCIKYETTKVTAISAVTGLPGGFAMLGTIPADLVQYFGHIFRILQKLIYLYGWQDLSLDSNEITEETKYLLTLFTGVMCGVNGAVKAVNKISGQIAKQIIKKLPQKTLTKGTIYPIVKKVATALGARMTKEIFSKGLAKAVPVVGAVVSGTITYATYKPMAKKLQKYLASNELASEEFYEKNKDIIDID